MKEQDHTIHVALAFDQNYITPFYVLLTSLFHNNSGNNIAVHCIATGISENEKKDIRKFVQENNADIVFYNIDEEYVAKTMVIPVNNYFTPAAYYRLFLPLLLPNEISKLLYIDTDAIVIGDLKELYNTNIGNAPFAAALDPYPVLRTDLGITEEGKYFNSGVLLIDTANWKQQNVTEDAIKFMVSNPEKIKFVDQDALNATQRGKWHLLDSKYNMLWSHVSLQMPRKQLVKNKVIIHYTTAHKPWNSLGRNKLRYLYHQYLKMSPRSHEKKYVDFKWDKKFLITFVRMRVKEFYFDHKLSSVVPIKSWFLKREYY